MYGQLRIADGSSNKRSKLVTPPFKADHQESGYTEPEILTPPPQTLEAPPTPSLSVDPAKSDVDEDDEWRHDRGQGNCDR